MARAQKLKVYRTVAGFHDAYVAAASQKAALAAWGSDKDLFARGIAEQVTDDALTAEPLAAPGTVIKRARGTGAENLAVEVETPQARRTGPQDPTPSKSGPKPKPSLKPKPSPKPKPLPKPKRDALDAADDALASLETEHRLAIRSIEQEEADLARRRRALERMHDTAMKDAVAARDATREHYDSARAAWLRSRT